MTQATPEKPAPPARDEEKARDEDGPSRLGRFIQTYSSFLSSFVIGIAGLVATSTYQCNQAEIARRQAESQQRVAETQAENNWKIERAKILSQNLNVLAAQGGGNVEQRYGVLLSLTRGSILDPELAVSYALELGKDNPDYMRVVLSNTTEKEYRRLAGAFAVTCEQRYGVHRDLPMCQADRHADRSTALSELLSEEADAALAAGKPGPLQLLRDDREVMASLARLLWLFMPLFDDLYDRRQWEMIAKIEAISEGARLVSALALLSLKNGDLLTGSERALLEQKAAERRAFLLRYLVGQGCDAECKARIATILLTGLTRSHGNFDPPLRALLNRPRAEVATVISRLHRRLLYCQVDPQDGAALRDRVLIPALQEDLPTLKDPRAEPAMIEDMLGLLATLPEPAAVDPAFAPYRALVDGLAKIGDGRLARFLAERRATTRRLRVSPPLALRKINFCRAQPDVEESSDEEEGGTGEGPG
jgi:hypothetical protein